MEYLYLWGISPVRGLIVLGPYDGPRDDKYQRQRAILAANNITPNDRWLPTRNQGAATAMIKENEMANSGQLNIGLNRARHSVMPNASHSEVVNDSSEVL